MTRALVASGWGDDYLTAVVWDGLQQLLGPENVTDAGATACLHSWGSPSPAQRIGGYHAGPCLAQNEGKVFDLLVVHAAALRDHDWHWPIALRDRHLKLGGKVVFVEGEDAANDIHPPQMPVDTVFRREIGSDIDYRVAYDRQPGHLPFAAPERWLDDPGSERPTALRNIDVHCVHGYHSHPLRWEVLSQVWRTHTHHFSLTATYSVQQVVTGRDWLDMLRNSKLVICTPGGSGCDCLRFWEAAACGAIPVFVGTGGRVREDWFTGEHAFFCDTAVELPALLDRALAWDLDVMRRNLLAHTRKSHTTAARARKVLEAVGMGVPP